MRGYSHTKYHASRVSKQIWYVKQYDIGLFLRVRVSSANNLICFEPDHCNDRKDYADHAYRWCKQMGIGV